MLPLVMHAARYSLVIRIEFYGVLERTLPSGRTVSHVRARGRLVKLFE